MSEVKSEADAISWKALAASTAASIAAGVATIKLIERLPEGNIWRETLLEDDFLLEEYGAAGIAATVAGVVVYNAMTPKDTFKEKILNERQQDVAIAISK